jgi:hypothetical protein
MKRKPRHYYCELYRVNYYFCIGWKAKDVQQFLAKAFGHDKDITQADGYTMLATSEDGAGIVVWTRHKDDHGVLAHEITHAASFTLGRAGVKASFRNDEAQAYLVGLLVEKALG